MADHVLVRLSERSERIQDPDLARIAKLMRATTLMQSNALARIEQILESLRSEVDRAARSNDTLGERSVTSSAVVLVVDDEPFNRKLLCRYLQSCGAHVIAADSVAEAISILGANHVDLMLIDETLPEGDGRQAWHALQLAMGSQALPSVGFVYSDATRVPEQTVDDTQFRLRLRKPATLDDIRRFVNLFEGGSAASQSLKRVWGAPPT